MIGFSTARAIAKSEGTSLVRVLEALQLPKARPVYRRAIKRSAEKVRDRSRRGYLSGQALNVVTGELRRSIVVGRLKNKPAHLGLAVGTTLKQAPKLHFASRGGHRPHPFLFPAAEDERRAMPAIWIEELERHTERNR